MKKNIFLLALMVVCSVSVWGQVPQIFSYQATLRDGQGELVSGKYVTMLFSILEDSEDGKVVYSEMHRVKTSVHGVASVTIGEQVEMKDLRWGVTPYYLKVDVDINGGSDFGLSTTQELLSVPYAMNVHTTDSIAGFDNSTEHQVLTMSGDTIYLTGGSYVVVPSAIDWDYNALRNKPTLGMLVNDMGYIMEETQVLSKRGDTVFLTGGSYVVMPKPFSGVYDSLKNKPTLPERVSDLINDAGYLTEEVQVLSITNDKIYLTGGSFVKLPKRVEYQTLADVAALGNNAGNKQIKGVMDPTEDQDAATLQYLNDAIEAWVYPEDDYGTHNILRVSECNGFEWHGERYDESGKYTYSYSNESGHYSVDTLILTIRNSTNNLETVRARDSYRWHNTEYTRTGRYTYNYYNDEGCESVDTLQLRLVNEDETLCEARREAGDTLGITVCGEVLWYGLAIRTSGMYEYNLGPIAAEGCDSIVCVNVTILPVYMNDTVVRTDAAYTWRGSVYTEQGDYGDTLTASNGCDSIYMLHLLMDGNYGVGATKGLFSVGNGVQVRFAKGNLQYQSSSNVWRFAEEQYEIMGVKCIPSYSSDWADLFGWATSGYHEAADTLCVNYMPYAYGYKQAKEGTDGFSYNQYGYGPSTDRTNVNMTGTNSGYDWGVNNAISNGGNEVNLWRTLSKEEWNHLMTQRRNANLLQSLGCIVDVTLPSGDTIERVGGYILLPDNWVCPEGVSFVPNGESIMANELEVAEWERMEEAGAVFLPMRVENTNIGTYWTQTSYDAGGAYSLAMTDDTCMLAPYNRGVKSSVRLVQNNRAGVASQNSTILDTVVVKAGDFNWHGKTYTESGEYVDVMRNSEGGDSVIYLTYIKVEDGELTGLFSVGDNKQVKFSKGNLQYNAQADVWRFADQQYGYIGDGNRYTSEHYGAWIDLFGWATSGYHNATDVMNLYYEPWSVTRTDVYGYGPSEQMGDASMVNTGAEYDWGVHNAIANGGNLAGEWRTLSSEEMDYLLDYRSNAYELKGFGVVHGVNGLIILPDNWVAPSGIIFASSEDEINRYDDAQWQRMEAAGAVFLPMGGSRNNGYIDNLEEAGNYWLSTRYISDYKTVYRLYFNKDRSIYVSSDMSGWGYNVRLVKDN